MKISTSKMGARGKSNWIRGLDWGLYDFANSGYYLVYVVFLYPVYLIKGPLSGDVWFEAKWGFAQGLAVVLAVLAGLLLGRKFDVLGLRRVAPWLLMLPAFASLLLPLFIYLESSVYTLFFGWILVQSLYLLALTVYDSSLTQVARGREAMGISGWAWGWGYIGGLTCMGVMQVGLIWWNRYSAADFLAGCLFFILFSALAAWRLPNLLKQQETAKFVPSAEQKPRIERWKLLLVFLLIVDGIAIFMSFFSSFATKIALVSDDDLGKMLAVLQLLAFPFTGIISGLTRYSVTSLLRFCGVAWLLAVSIAMASPGPTTMWISVVIVASAVGTTQALLRAIYADSVDPAQAVSGFGVYAVVEKGAAFLGPALAGLLIVGFGHRAVIGFAGLMTFVGCLVLANLIKSVQRNTE